jgi:hypothetical protein
MSSTDMNILDPEVEELAGPNLGAETRCELSIAVGYVVAGADACDHHAMGMVDFHGCKLAFACFCCLHSIADQFGAGMAMRCGRCRENFRSMETLIPGATESWWS